MLKAKPTDSLAGYRLRPYKLTQNALMNNSSILVQEGDQDNASETHKEEIFGAQNSVSSNSENESKKNFRIKKQRASKSLGPPATHNIMNASKAITLIQDFASQPKYSKRAQNISFEKLREQDQQRESDFFFENFDKIFIVKFPPPSKGTIQPDKDYYPSRVNRALIFDEIEDISKEFGNTLANTSFRNSGSNDQSLCGVAHRLLTDSSLSQDEQCSLKDSSNLVDAGKPNGRCQSISFENSSNLTSQTMTSNTHTINVNLKIVLPILNGKNSKENTSFQHIDTNHGPQKANEKLLSSYYYKGSVENKSFLLDHKRQNLAAAASNRVEKHLNKLERYVSLIQNEHNVCISQSNKENIEFSAFPRSYLDQRRPINHNMDLSRYHRPNLDYYKVPFSGKENFVNADSESFDQGKYCNEIARLNSRVRENQAGLAHIFEYKKARENHNEQKKDASSNGQQEKSHPQELRHCILRDLTNYEIPKANFQAHNINTHQNGEKIVSTLNEKYTPKPAYEILRASRRNYENKMTLRKILSD